MSRYDRTYNALYNEDYRFQTLTEYKTYLSAVYGYIGDKLDYVTDQRIRHASDLFFLTRMNVTKSEGESLVLTPNESDRIRLLAILDSFYASYGIGGIQIEEKEKDRNVYVSINSESPFYDALVHQTVSAKIRQLQLLV